MKDRERERLERTIARQEDAIFRQSSYILRLHGGEVHVPGGREKRRGRPRGSSDVTAAAILAAHRELHAASGLQVTQEALATKVNKTVAGLKYLLKLYGLPNEGGRSDRAMSVLPVDVPRIAAVSGGQRPDDVGEGPVWDDREHCVWWVDILGESIHRTDPLTGQEEMIAVGRMVGALGLREDGGLVAAVRDRSVAVNAASGHIERVATGGKPDQPHAGCLFACRPSVRGRPGHRFAG